MDETTEITVTLSPEALAHVQKLLDHELAGHHNRAEDYLVGQLSGLSNSVERATDCMHAAHQTRQVRALFNRAERQHQERVPTERELNEAHGV